MRNICPICHADLSVGGSIFAAQGKLYCSTGCVSLDCKDVPVSAIEDYVTAITEEILPEDAGIHTLAKDVNCDMCSLDTFTCGMSRLATHNAQAPCMVYKSYDEMVEAMGYDPLEITSRGII